jgi:CDP-diacylglycerol--serine O-phosphatidyltransferase
MMEQKKRTFRQKGIYILPSLLTAMALFVGFFSIIHSLRGMAGEVEDFRWAAFAIVLAAFIDGLDGRIARLMKAESDFGSQFDSIADVVSFGVAPAVLVYASTIHALDRWGWIGAFLFVACAGIRLARFNVIANQNGGSRKYFKGLSSPVAAGGVALLIIVPHSWSGFGFQVFSLVYTVLLSALMISNIRFRSFKQDSFQKKPVQILLFFIVLFSLLIAFPAWTLLGCFAIYLGWGVVEEMILFRRRRRSDPQVPFVPFGDRETDQS